MVHKTKGTAENSIRKRRKSNHGFSHKRITEWTACL